MHRATLLTEYFKRQAKRALHQVDARSRDKRIEKVLAWIMKHGPTVSLRDLQNNNVGGVITAAAARALLRELEELGFGYLSFKGRNQVSFTLNPEITGE